MRARNENAMWSRLFREFDGKGPTLQSRIKEMLVHAILEGFVSDRARLPSSRALAEALGLSRTTVTIALQRMLDHGFLVSRPRSGLYVNREILTPYLGAAAAPARPSGIDWRGRLRVAPSRQRNIAKPRDWHSYDYPFVYGQFDRSLFPVADWRECALDSLNVKAIHVWSPDQIDRDLDPLIEQVQRRFLPSRGIWAGREEILVTLGGQQACYLIADLLMGPRTVAGVEDPGYPDARNNFGLRAHRVVPLPIDQGGLIVSRRRLAECDYVYVTPSHQCPTNVTMPLDRREALLAAARELDFVVVEDDHESELNFAGRPLPALKSLDRDGRVIYVGSLSKTLAHGVRIGFVVADAALIAELRALRRLNLRHPPANNAYAAALFLAQGHRDSFVARLNTAYRERRNALLAALAARASEWRTAPSTGGSAAWVTLPEAVDGRALVHACAERGVLIETGDIFFARAPKRTRHLRLGYSAIPADRIDAGVRELKAAYDAVRRRPSPARRLRKKR
jgi:GntR family transcriptional regulator / MocR family aminotransferase